MNEQISKTTKYLDLMISLLKVYSRAVQKEDLQQTYRD